MSNKVSHKSPSAILLVDTEKIISPGYPSYPPEEDIYNNYTEGTEIDPEDILQVKSTNDDNSSRNRDIFRKSGQGDDLDVPGSELDDDQEEIGCEDEENNYYSLGGDDHEDLDEDKGE
jgi:hypothetical protein